MAVLHRLLEEQVTCAREGNLARVDELSESTDAVVAEIVAHGGIASGAMGAQRNDLKRLYSELILSLTAERADVEARLKQLRRVKHAIGIYGGTTRV